MNIVGISGPLGSGKDTVADVFVKEGFVKISLADPMKRFVRDVFGASEASLWGPSNLRNAPIACFESDPGYHWTVSEVELDNIGQEWVDSLLPNASTEARDSAFASLQTWFTGLKAAHQVPSPRVVLQTLGTEWGRAHLHENVWVDYLYNIAGELASPDYGYNKYYGRTWNTSHTVTRGIVVPDIRFRNELQFFKENAGCKLVRIVRPGVESAAESVGMFQHQSEMEQRGFPDEWFDAIVTNDGSLAQLLESARILTTAYAE